MTKHKKACFIKFCFIIILEFVVLIETETKFLTETNFQIRN